MRVSTIASLALAAAPLAIAKQGRLGWAIGTKKTDGSCKLRADYEADFDALSGTGTIVRTYSCVDASVPGVTCQVAQEIIPAASAKGMQVILGVWADTEEAYTTDKEALIAAVGQHPEALYAATVGSESMYRYSQDPTTGLTAGALLERIHDMQGALSHIKSDLKVGTADSWNIYADGTANVIIGGGVEILLVNAFAYWQHQDISNSTDTYLDDLQAAMSHIQHLNGSTTAIELWNGETGWPTDGGDNYGAAIAGTKNAATFFKHGVCAALSWGFDAFYFEAFDEPWKPDSKGENGQYSDEKHWGAFDSNRVAKFSLNC